MGKKWVTEIEIERHETLVIRPPRPEHRPACQGCAGAETMLRPEEAAALAGASLRTVFRWVEMAVVHFAETPGGGLYVCARTLPLGWNEAPGEIPADR